MMTQHRHKSLAAGVPVTAAAMAVAEGAGSVVGLGERKEVAMEEEEVAD